VGEEQEEEGGKKGSRVAFVRRSVARHVKDKTKRKKKFLPNEFSFLPSLSAPF